MLFTMEITADEIDRTCEEASLLHSLRSSSRHIVGLFGIAVLPPSLCVVLEMCSEGSLFDLLQRRSSPRLAVEAAGARHWRRAGSRGSRNRPAWLQPQRH